MAFWNRQSRKKAKAEKARRKAEVKKQEAFSAVTERAAGDVLHWMRDALSLVFRELNHKDVLVQAIKNLDASTEWEGLRAAIEAEMSRLTAPPVQGETAPPAEEQAA